MIEIKELCEEMKEELRNHIAPFWNQMRDSRGGYYGFMDYNLNIEKDADKGVILHSRILWFYSNLYLLFQEQEALDHARHAYHFLKQYCVDCEYGGVYWMMRYDGTPLEDMKHTYNQAFAIYGLSSYFAASGDREALETAYTLYRLVEDRSSDSVGYREAFSRSWELIENKKLSEDGYDAKKSMNTLLHIIEAYTELYRVDQNPEVGESLKRSLLLCRNKVYDADTHILRVFFNEKMESIADIYSYGHDIEASWLIDRACEVLGDEALNAQLGNMTAQIAEAVLQTAYDGGALNNQSCRGTVDKTRIWWVQAESVVGFFNAYQKSGDRKYLAAAMHIWDYIKNDIIDKRENSEWFWSVDYSGRPSDKPIVEPWKCPYHNGRMCMEVIKRNADI